jgi:hypothetical protein
MILMVLIAADGRDADATCFIFRFSTDIIDICFDIDIDSGMSTVDLILDILL